MYYRIKENKLYDYADYQYSDDCIETSLITKDELNQNREKVIIQNGILILNPDYESEQLAKAKALKLSDINTAKEKAFKEGVIFNSNHFDCDDRAQDRTGNRLLLLQAMPVETLEWLDFNYKPVVLTAVEFQELCAAIFERVQFIEFKTGQLMDAVSNARTIEEIEAINITFDEETQDENTGKE